MRNFNRNRYPHYQRASHCDFYCGYATRRNDLKNIIGYGYPLNLRITLSHLLKCSQQFV